MRSFTTIITPVFLIMIASSLFAKEELPASEQLVCKDYDVFVLRHLDKEQGKDPSLSEKGKANAKLLAQLPVLKDVSHGFYTPYKRTYETLEFIDVPKEVYQPGETKELALNIKNNFCGKSVIIVGHSNTVPAIIKAFGGGFNVSYAGKKLQKEPSIMLSESDYGSIFRITFHNERLHQQFYRVKQKAVRKVSD